MNVNQIDPSDGQVQGNRLPRSFVELDIRDRKVWDQNGSDYVRPTNKKGEIKGVSADGFCDLEARIGITDKVFSPDRMEGSVVLGAGEFYGEIEFSWLEFYDLGKPCSSCDQKTPDERTHFRGSFNIESIGGIIAGEHIQTYAGIGPIVVMGIPTNGLKQQNRDIRVVVGTYFSYFDVPATESDGSVILEPDGFDFQSAGGMIQRLSVDIPCSDLLFLGVDSRFEIPYDDFGNMLGVKKLSPWVLRFSTNLWI